MDEILIRIIHERVLKLTLDSRQPHGRTQKPFGCLDAHRNAHCDAGGEAVFIKGGQHEQTLVLATK